VRRKGTTQRVLLALAVLAAAVAPVAGSPATGAPAKRTPPRAALRASPMKGATVFAAASLTEVFQAMAPKERYSFAGSDQLAFQIQQGAPADVFASASVRYPDDLYSAGLVTKPHIFTFNNLVVIVPKKNPAGITSIQDLAKPGVKVVIGDQGVPVGSYTRTVLRKLNLNSVLRNVVSNEADVKAVVGKVALNEADAGVVYQTDVGPAKSFVTPIAIPSEAQPVVAYEIAVVKSSPNRAAAREFVKYLLNTDGQAWLRRYGFIVPPKTR
jgi:molybdate transport system substrate-binding protein